MSVRNVNGHDLFLPPATEAVSDASHTDWIIVKFDRFADYKFKQELGNLEVHDHFGDNAYLCKYIPTDLTSIINIEAVTHLALYPRHVVPMAHLGDVERTQTETPETVKMPFVLALHPDPCQSPEQVLEIVQTRFRAEHLNDHITGNTIRVKLDPADILPVS